MRAFLPIERRLVSLVAALAPAIMSNVACAGVLNADNLPTMTWSMEGSLQSSWAFAPTLDMFAPLSGAPGYEMTSSPTFVILGGGAQVTIQSLSFEPDPFVMNNIQVTNLTDDTQVFSAFVGLPTTFGAPNLISGELEMTVTDGGFDGAIVATDGGVPIYQAQIDAVTVGTLLDAPFSLIAASGGDNSMSASFGPDISGVAVTSFIGIQLRFSLTPGDSVSIQSRFDVVKVPGPAAISLLGIAALCTPKRRRRA